MSHPSQVQEPDFPEDESVRIFIRFKDQASAIKGKTAAVIFRPPLAHAWMPDHFRH